MTCEGPRRARRLSRGPLLALALLLSAACADRPANSPPKEETGRGVLRVAIELPGDDIPSPAELEALGPLLRSVGTVIRSSAGMGRIELSLSVEDQGRARGQAEALLQHRFPAGRIVFGSLAKPGASPADQPDFLRP